MPLLLLLGVPAYIVGAALNTASLDDPNLSPKIYGVDAQMAVAIAGGILSLIASGPIAMIGLGSAIGALVSQDSTNKVRKGLAAQSMNAAQAATQLPGGAVSPVPQLVAPNFAQNVGPSPAPAAAPAEQSFWSSFFNN